MLKKFNDYFQKKKVIFALDKIVSENGKENNNYDDITCVMFT